MKRCQLVYLSHITVDGPFSQIFCCSLLHSKVWSLLLFCEFSRAKSSHFNTNPLVWWKISLCRLLSWSQIHCIDRQEGFKVHLSVSSASYITIELDNGSLLPTTFCKCDLTLIIHQYLPISIDWINMNTVLCKDTVVVLYTVVLLIFGV